jgi:hypothetical protein
MTGTTADAPTAEPASHAVLAAYRRGHSHDWTGRYLHDAPSIAEVAMKLCQIVHQRYRGDAVPAAQEMLDTHPAGWRTLGAATAKDPELKIRKRPAPLGECLCHEPDGTPTQALIASGMQVLAGVDHGNMVRPTGYLPGTDPTSAGHWTITKDSPLPPGTTTIFMLGHEALVIGVRGPERRFIRAGSVAYSGPEPQNLKAVIASAGKLASRTAETMTSEAMATDLDRTRRVLEGIPSHHDLVLHLLSQRGTSDAAKLEAAVAREAGVHPAELPGHLHRLDRQGQTALLSAAADRLDPDRHQTRHSEEL